MNNYIILFSLNFAFLFLYSCKDVNVPVKFVDDVIVDAGLFQSSNSDDFQIIDIFLEEDIITIEINYGGGCGNATMQLIDSEAVMESLPVQRILKFVFEDQDNCEALINTSYEFDLSNIKLEGYHTIVLNIENHDNALIYNY